MHVVSIALTDFCGAMKGSKIATESLNAVATAAEQVTAAVYSPAC